MKYTFLIGNGFDLNLGLNTSFSSFFKEYCKVDVNDSTAVALLKNEIRSDMKAWSDFELQMGLFTQKVQPMGPLSKQEYFDCMEDFRNKLVAYIQKEEERINEHAFNDYRSWSCYSSIEYPFQYLRPGAKRIMDEFVEKHLEESIEYNFIVFNYSTTFDKYLTKLGYNVVNATPEDGPHHYTDDTDDSVIYDNIGSVIHIHGVIGEAILMGLNDEQQVVNRRIAEDDQFKCNYIKPLSNTMLEELREKRAEEIINKSDIIIIYGMSLGETDRYWWRCIADWLCTNESDCDRFLLVFTYDPKLSRNAPYDNLKNQTEIRERILSFSTIPIAEWKKDCRNNILCSLNSEIFNNNTSLNTDLFTEPPRYKQDTSPVF